MCSFQTRFAILAINGVLAFGERSTSQKAQKRWKRTDLAAIARDVVITYRDNTHWTGEDLLVLQASSRPCLLNRDLEEINKEINITLIIIGARSHAGSFVHPRGSESSICKTPS